MPPWRSASSRVSPPRPTPLLPSPSSSFIPPPQPVPSVPAPGLVLPTPPQPQPQPRTVKLTSSALLSLPYRLTHPPPVKNQVASWGIVPAFDIKLQDVLDRKQLPPLGLKDFEEWLLFVEHTPQDLYFILWLREYTTRYNTWAQQSRQQQALLFSTSNTHSPLSTANPHQHHDQRTLLRHTSTSSLFPSHPNKPFILPPSSPSQPSFVHSNPRPLTSPIPPSPPPSPTPSLHPPSPPRKTYYHPRYMLGPPLQPPTSLALFYARAKETFLTPNGPYELQVPTDVLSIFHLTEGKPLAPPPDPAIFNELAYLIEQNLKDSLERFVIATFNNVGTPRAHCGSVGGLSIGLMWSVPPLIASFTLGGARWWRLIALPGMWLGLTIFISAMYGVCMMIYVFGDLRQLRSFELSRPPISPPKPLSTSHSANPLTPTLNAFATANRERKGSVSREMISSPIRAPKPITRPPRAIVVGARPSITTIGSQVSGNGDKKSDSKGMAPGARTRWSRQMEEVRQPPSALPPSSQNASAASLSLKSSSSSVICSDQESDDEGYAESIASSVYSKRRARRARIFISDAFYDEHPSPEGPATATFSLDGTGLVWGGGVIPNRPVRGPPLWPDYQANEEEEANATATFIGRYVYEDTEFKFGSASCTYSRSTSRSQSLSGDDIEAQTCQRAVERQPVKSFDFDALPPRRPRAASKSSDLTSLAYHQQLVRNRTSIPSSMGAGSIRPVESYPHPPQVRFDEEKQEYVDVKQPTRPSEENIARRSGWRSRVLVYIQNKCSPGNAVSFHLRTAGGEALSGSSSPVSEKSASFQHASLSKKPTKYQAHSRPRSGSTVSVASWREGFRRVSKVPAFASPLTPVLNPIVGRAQWEIVVRSALMSAVFSLVVIGALLAVPEFH